MELDPKKWMKDHKKATKSYEIIKTSRKPKSEFDRIIVDGKEYKFGRSMAMRVRDKKVAKDIADALPDDVLVYEVDDVPTRDNRGHNYFFAVPKLPWKDKDDSITE